MAVLYVGAGVNHFVSPAFYVAIMPPYIPWHLEMVWLSGVAEIVLGVGVLIPKTRRVAGWLILAMLAVFMTVHVHMLTAPEGTFDEVPRWALWLRIPMQGVLALWAWWVTKPDARRIETASTDAALSLESVTSTRKP